MTYWNVTWETTFLTISDKGLRKKKHLKIKSHLFTRFACNNKWHNLWLKFYCLHLGNVVDQLSALWEDFLFYFDVFFKKSLKNFGGRNSFFFFQDISPSSSLLISQFKDQWQSSTYLSFFFVFFTLFLLQDLWLSSCPVKYVVFQKYYIFPTICVTCHAVFSLTINYSPLFYTHNVT